MFFFLLVAISGCVVLMSSLGGKRCVQIPSPRSSADRGVIPRPPPLRPTFPLIPTRTRKMESWLAEWEIRMMIGLDARAMCVGRRECGKLLRHATTEARHLQRRNLFQMRMSSRSSKILSIFRPVTFCFSTALCALTGWLQPHTSAVV